MAGLAIGLAVASRYFMVLLVAPFAFLSAAAWWGSERRRSGRALGALALGLAAIPTGFLLAVPGFLANLPDPCPTAPNRSGDGAPAPVHGSLGSLS